MAHFLTLQSVDAILDLVRLFPPMPAEELALERAFGRILAEALYCPEDLPGFSRSTMDGFAVRAKDVFGASEGLPALLEYIGECPMGEAPGLRIQAGQTARIWTGGMLPDGADAVVMLEFSREAGTHIELTRPVAPGDNVILKGEDAAKDALLLPPGCLLRPQEVGLLAACGQSRVHVRKKPRVAVISSGDEVIPITDTPGPGQVRDINTYSLMALAEAAGATSRSFGLVRDDRKKLESAVSDALDASDVVLLSGGSSAGQRDYTVHALASLPGCEILAHGVAISPGKPLIMARLGDKSLWGLPGHAASALVCAEVFIRPLIDQLLGRSPAPAWRESLRAEMTRSVGTAQGRRDYIRVSLEPPLENGALPRARPVMGKSGLISTLVAADALAVCAEDHEGLNAGQSAPIRLLL